MYHSLHLAWAYFALAGGTLCSYPNPPRYLDGDCTDVATVGMAVAVSILVAFVTACVNVGPPSAELAAWGREMSFQVLMPV